MSMAQPSPSAAHPSCLHQGAMVTPTVQPPRPVVELLVEEVNRARRATSERDAALRDELERGVALQRMFGADKAVGLAMHAGRVAAAAFLGRWRWFVQQDELHAELRRAEELALSASSVAEDAERRAAEHEGTAWREESLSAEIAEMEAALEEAEERRAEAERWALGEEQRRRDAEEAAEAAQEAADLTLHAAARGDTYGGEGSSRHSGGGDAARRHDRLPPHASPCGLRGEFAAAAGPRRGESDSERRSGEGSWRWLSRLGSRREACGGGAGARVLVTSDVRDA